MRSLTKHSPRRASQRAAGLTSGLFLALALTLPAPAQDAAETKVAGYRLKNRSTYSAPATARAPFWPIGWKPVDKNAPKKDEAPAFTLNPDQFRVTSILLGSRSLALINGRAYGEGETLRATRIVKQDPNAPAGSQAPAIPANIKIRVAAIKDGEVILQAENQSVSVPLKRPAMGERKPGDDIQALSESQ